MPKSYQQIIEQFLYATLTPEQAGCAALLATLGPTEIFQWGVNAAKQRLQDIATENGKDTGGVPPAAPPAPEELA
jgi:hypothetical protein